MSKGLPSMKYACKQSVIQQVQFGGYNHRDSAQDGELYDMKNITAEMYPILSPRKPRYKVATLKKPNGLYRTEHLYWVDGTDLYQDGQVKMQVTDSKKQFTSIGSRVVIFPDKVWLDEKTGKHGTLNAEWSGSAKITDGTYEGISAKANTITAPGANWSERFRPGDGVTISGCKTHPENNRPLVIRQIDGDNLRFYENSFVIGPSGDQETITIKREVPDLDFVFSRENRLFGCKGDTIYASKLGDERNWNVFDGIASDSYAVQSGTPGAFTGCCGFKGYCVFFKEEAVYKLYGDRPSNYQLMDSASLGVAKGSGNSLAIAGETLFYLSRTGVVAYSGGFPQNIAAPFGQERYRSATAGSDGRRYFVSMQNEAGQYEMFVFSPEIGMWHKQDDSHVISFAGGQDLYWLAADGTVWLDGNAMTIPEKAEPESAVDSMVEFGDIVEGSPNKKITNKFQIRAELDAGAYMQIMIQFDGDGKWIQAAQIRTNHKKSFLVPIIPRRADHYKIRIKGHGAWKIYSMTRHSYAGSER